MPNGSGGGVAAISGPQSLALEVGGQPYFLELTPFSDPFGLSLLVATIVPEQAYTAGMEAASRTNLYFITAAFFVMAAIMALIARWITGPILKLKHQVDVIADGKAAGSMALDRQDEIGDLSRAFMDMTEKLNESFSKLRQSNTELSKQVHALAALSDSDT